MLRRNRHLIWVPFSVVFLLAATLSVVSAFPPNSIPFLTFKGTGNDTEAGEYYSNLDLTLGSASTLDQWKSLYGFNGVNDVRAVYYNAGDLGFGREMHCRKNVADALNAYFSATRFGSRVSIPAASDSMKPPIRLLLTVTVHEFCSEPN